VEGTLVLTTVDNTGLLEEVRDDRSTRDGSVLIEGDLDELTEARRVVVLGGLGVTEGLKERVSLQELLLELALSTLGASNGSEVLNDLLGVLSLTSTRLTGDKHRLRLTLAEEIAVGFITDSEGVGSKLIAALAVVELNDLLVVNGEQLVGVDHDAEESRVSIDDVSIITKLKVVEHGGLREITKLSTILDTVELDRVHAVDFILLINLLSLILSKLDNSDVGVRLVDDDSGLITLVAFSGNPNVLLIRLLGVTRTRGLTVLQVRLVIVQTDELIESRHCGV